MIEHAVVKIEDLLSPLRGREAFKNLDMYMHTYGFVSLWDDRFTADSQWALFRFAELFFNQPLSEKAKVSNIKTYKPGHGIRGFLPVNESRLCESFNIRLEIDDRTLSEVTETARPLFCNNTWPDITGFRSAYIDYMKYAQDLCKLISTLFENFYGLRPGSITDGLRHSTDHIRINHYNFKNEDAEKMPVHFGAHTDMGLLTALIFDGQPGLEVEVEGEWQEYHATRGSIVLNAGDIFSIITNNHWKASKHRVRQSPAVGQYSRTSIAYFLNGSHDWNLKCLPGFCDDKTWNYLPCTVYEHMEKRVKYLMKLNRRAVI